MRILRLSALAQLFYFICVPTVSAAADVVIGYSEPLTQLSFSTRPISPMPAADQTESRQAALQQVDAMQFDAFGRRFDIGLEENRALMTAASRQQVGEAVDAYRGEISGNADSWVRLTIVDGVPSGMLWDGTEAFAIDTVDGETAIYRLADLRIESGILSCSQAGVASNGDDFLKVVLGEVSANAAKVSGPGAIVELDLAVVGDFEFFSVKGVSAEADIIRRMNNVDGIFSAQLGVQLNINEIEVFTAGGDPFADESDPGQYLDDFAEYRSVTPAQYANGLSHLFTGRNLDGSTVGIAFGGGSGSALCSRRFGAGLTQGTHSTTFDSLIAAHEFGHNFGAPHDGTNDSACEATEQDFLMAPSLNGSDVFSACSITQMQDDVNRASCISPLPIGDIELVVTEAAITALQGNAANIVFEMNNRGSQAVGNAEISVSIPNNVTVESVTAGSGTCSTGAGAVSCTFGTLAGGSGETVTITVATPQAGTGDFAATASADDDANAINNQATVQLTIEPAVELVVNITASVTQIEPDQSTTLQYTVENRATVTASNVTMTFTVDAGIRVDSVTWDSGSCEIDGTVVTCMTPSLAGEVTSNLSLQVTGITEGIQDYSVSISAAEADRDISNNDAEGQLNVTTASNNPGTPAARNSGGSGGGGGGSSGIMLLLGLFWLKIAPGAYGGVSRRQRSSLSRLISVLRSNCKIRVRAKL